MVDILLASCNGETYLRTQIESILRQREISWHLYARDDASGDGTREMLGKYQRRFPQKISLAWNPSPQGPGENFFHLLSQSRGDYSCFSDQDDVWHPEKLSLTLRFMKALEAAYPRQPVLVHSDLVLVDENVRSLGNRMCDFTKLPWRGDVKLRLPFQGRKADCYIRQSPWLLSRLLVENHITGNTVMINKRLRELFRPPARFCMHDWWLGLMGAALGVVGYIHVPLTAYRQHGANVLGVKSPLHPGQLVKRLTAGEAVRQNYREMFAQARCFYKMYGPLLQGTRQQRILREFIAMEHGSRGEKIKSILQYRFVKSTWPLTLGEMLCL